MDCRFSPILTLLLPEITYFDDYSIVRNVPIINEVMTSWNGSPSVQFVEIQMLLPANRMEDW